MVKPFAHIGDPTPGLTDERLAAWLHHAARMSIGSMLASGLWPRLEIVLEGLALVARELAARDRGVDPGEEWAVVMAADACAPEMDRLGDPAYRAELMGAAALIKAWGRGGVPGLN